MGFMHIDATTAAAAEEDVVTLSGGTAFAFDLFAVSAGWRFANTGTAFKITNGLVTQVSSDTDWIFPRTSFDPTDYEIRVHRNSGSSTTSGNSFDTWIVLDFAREWIFSCTAFCVQINELVIDIRYQDGTGPKNIVSSLFDSAPCMASTIYLVDISAEGFF